jgi:hypothetical protein
VIPHLCRHHDPETGVARGARNRQSVQAEVPVFGHQKKNAGWRLPHLSNTTCSVIFATIGWRPDTAASRLQGAMITL